MTEQPQLTDKPKDDDPNVKKQPAATTNPPETPKAGTIERAKKASKVYHGEVATLKDRVTGVEKSLLEITEHLKTHEAPEPTPEATPQTPKEHREPKPDEKVPTHYVKNWMANCPECGDANPNFKDETQCKACGQHLGSVETAKKLDNCPYCGKNEGVRKI